MATITGFTAERMLVIEKETVVDGEVRGDNLYLMTREGIEINAGSVRGPAGPTGPTGPVVSVNEQNGVVSAPRIFTNKTALDAWTSAPIGAFALTADTATTWQKISTGWIVDNVVRVFASNADRDSRWATPANGSLAVTTDTNTLWERSSGVWQKPWSGAWGQMGYGEWPSGSGDISSTPAYTGLSVGRTDWVAGRRLRISGSMTLLHSGTVGHTNLYVRDQGTTIIQSNLTMGIGEYATLHFARNFTTTIPNKTYDIYISTDTGIVQIIGGGAFTAHMLLEDLGPV